MMEDMMRAVKGRQNGGVSLFVVIFATLLFTIIAVGFIRLLVRDQQQASATNLSQAALDAAQNGIEDGKRAILKSNALGYTAGSGNGVYSTAAESNDCQTSLGALADILGYTTGSTPNNTTTDPSTTKILRVNIDKSTNYNEAYTCLKVSMNTSDYVGQLTASGSGNSAIIPLAATGAYDRIQLNWYNAADEGINAPAQTTFVPTALPLPLMSGWSTTNHYPPLLESQIVQVPSSFTLASLQAPANGTTKADTMFLYPQTNSVVGQTLTSPGSFTDDALGNPTEVQCDFGALSTGGYACSATFSVLNPSTYGILRLASFYTGAHYQVRLYNGTTPVDFAGVEPIIDATGNAGNAQGTGTAGAGTSGVFSRLVTRVVLSSPSFQYPDAAVDTSGSLCKVFTVTPVVTDYGADPGGTGCTP